MHRRDHYYWMLPFDGKMFIFRFFFFRFIVIFSVDNFVIWISGGGRGFRNNGGLRGYGQTPLSLSLYIYILVVSVVCVYLRCTHLEFRRPIWAASIPGSLAASADPCLPLTVFVLYICGNNTSNHYSVRYLPQNKHAIRSIHLVLCVYMYIVNK